MKPTRRQRSEVGAWSPWNELSRLRSEINRIFESRDFPGFGGTQDWIPSTDVAQDQDKFTVKAELPGFRREDINLSIEGNRLTISGERKQEQEGPGEEPYRSERFYGRFQREVILPEPVDAEKANASYKDGVLCVYLPKTEQSKRKQIQVRSSDSMED